MNHRRRYVSDAGRTACLTWILWLFALPAQAAEYQATPENYRNTLRSLQPGDTLSLSPGVYVDNLQLHNLHGAENAPITIQAEKPGSVVFFGNDKVNTISIANASHLIVRNLVLNGRASAVDAVKAEGYSLSAHHITIENLDIANYAQVQGNVGISTKCPAWDWTIRGNRIIATGTGMYLGNSDGRAPFVAGVIENNLIVGSIGYNIQIKQQLPRPEIAGLPQAPSRTIIRHNLLLKTGSSSRGKEARPNLLVGHWPLEGPGKDDRYEIYGNLLFQNPSEALFQGEGNLAFYNNLLVNGFGDAIHIQPHNDIPRKIDIFHNTVIARGAGIAVRTGLWASDFVQRVDRNAVFAAQPLSGGLQGVNLSGDWRDAPRYLRRPFASLAQLRLDPLEGKLQLRGPEPPWMIDYVDASLDYEGRTASDGYLGAYFRATPRLPVERWLNRSAPQGLIFDEK